MAHREAVAEEGRRSGRTELTRRMLCDGESSEVDVAARPRALDCVGDGVPGETEPTSGGRYLAKGKASCGYQ